MISEVLEGRSNTSIIAKSRKSKHNEEVEKGRLEVLVTLEHGREKGDAISRRYLALFTTRYDDEVNPNLN